MLNSTFKTKILLQILPLVLLMSTAGTCAKEEVESASLTNLEVQTPTLKGQAEYGKTLSATNLQNAPQGATRIIKWYSGALELNNLSAEHTLTTADIGKKIRVGVSFTSENSTSKEAVSDESAIVVFNPHKPKITGTPLLGNTLSALTFKTTEGNWATDVKWYRDNEPIPNESSLSYQISKDDHGKKIRIGVTYSNLDLGQKYKELLSDQTETAVAPTPQKPTITGTMILGNEIQANLTGNISEGWAIDYTWYRGSTVNPDVKTKYYTLSPEDLGHRIIVTVAFKKNTARSPKAQSDPTAPVNLPDPEKPSIGGTFGLGQRLTAYLPETPKGLVRKIRWYRGNSPIIGQSTEYYTLTSADVDQQIIVSVQFKKGNTSSTEVKSTSTEKLPITAPLTPIIRGGSDPYLGVILLFLKPTVPNGLVLKIKWYRNGTQIPSQSTVAYTLSPEDIGKKISVGVTLSKGSLTSTETQSDPTALVYIKRPSLPKIIPPSTPHYYPQKLSISAINVPVGITQTIQWYRNQKPITGATAKDYNMTSDDIGKKIQVGIVLHKGAVRSVEALSQKLANVIIKPADKPGISGTVNVGSTLSAVVSPTPKDLALIFKWYRNGIQVLGESKKTYDLTSTDAGTKISLGILYDYKSVKSAEAPSNPTVIVGISKPTKPTIGGIFLLGETITATLPTAPTGISSSIKWYRNGTLISGATLNSYSLVADDIGKKISVGVTFSKGSIKSTETKSNNTVAIGIGAPSAFTLSGTSEFGATLSLSLPTVPSGLTQSIKWYQGSNIISGITANSYVLVANDVGQQISVGITFSKDSYSSAETKSNTTGAVTIPAHTTKPTISGTVALGQTLTASLPAPPTGLSNTVKWYRDGTLISGATNTTYTLLSEDIGKKISVGVSRSKNGISSSVLQSTQTLSVSIPAATTPTISGTPTSGQTLAANLPATPAGLSRTIQWYRGTTPIGSANNTSYTLTATDVGNKISVGITFSKGLTNSPESKSSETTTVI